MAYFTTIADVHKNRPFKPRYARTQATAQAVTINPSSAANIFPGCVLTRIGGTDTVTAGVHSLEGTGVVDIFTGASGTAPAGICGTFAKELELTGQHDVAMWVLGSDAIFACQSFDATASWTAAASSLADGAEVLLTANASGALTVAGSTDTAVCRLVGIEAAGAGAPATILVAGLN